MKKILVADDAHDINLLITNYLKGRDYEVSQVYNGEEAIETLSGTEDFDLLILDVIMPQQDGVDVLNHMQNKDIKTPVIGMSAGGITISGEVALKTIEAKVDSFINKPFKLKELADTVEKALSA